MESTFLVVPHQLVRHYNEERPVVGKVVVKGYAIASVWGAVRFIAIKNGGVCEDPHHSIAYWALASERTVSRALQILVRDGYLKRVRKHTIHRPAAYKVTKKLTLKTAKRGDTEGPTPGKSGRVQL